MNAPIAPPTPVAQSEPASAGVRQALTAIVSELCEVDAAQIGEDFVLASAGRLRSSLGRATLDAKIRRRLGVRIENLHTLRTFGDLEAAVAAGSSGAPAPPSQIPKPASAEMSQPMPPLRSLAKGAPTFLSAQRSNWSEAPASSGAQVWSAAKLLSAESRLACGIDVESISSLPEAKDYWEEPFYKANFTPAEIAYCVGQANPRMHFAARWCAKEALKKCLPAYTQWEMKRIEVVRGEAGRPYLRLTEDGGAKTPPVALSLTHSEDWALAMVVSGAERPAPTSPRPRGSATGSRIGLCLSLAALVCSLLALILALIRW